MDNKKPPIRKVIPATSGKPVVLHSLEQSMEERLQSIGQSPTRKCTFADEGDREGYSYDIRDTDLAWLFQMILSQKALIESQSRILEGFISDVEDLKARLINVRDNVQTANTAVILEDRDEALYEANDSLNYLIDFMLDEIEEGFKQ